MENDPENEGCQRPKMYRTLKDHVLKAHTLEVPYEYKVEEAKQTCRECGCLITRRHFSSHNSKTNCSTWLRYIYYQTVFPHFREAQIKALIMQDQKDLVLKMIDLYGDEKMKSVRLELERVKNICDPHAALDRSVYQHRMENLAPVRTHDLKSFGFSGSDSRALKTNADRNKALGEVYDGLPVTYQEVLEAKVVPAFMAEFWLKRSATDILGLVSLQKEKGIPQFKLYKYVRLSEAVLVLPPALRVLDEFQAKMLAEDNAEKERKLALKKFVKLDSEYDSLFSK